MDSAEWIVLNSDQHRQLDLLLRFRTTFFFVCLALAVFVVDTAFFR